MIENQNLLKTEKVLKENKNKPIFLIQTSQYNTKVQLNLFSGRQKLKQLLQSKQSG